MGSGSCRRRILSSDLNFFLFEFAICNTPKAESFSLSQGLRESVALNIIQPYLSYNDVGSKYWKRKEVSLLQS